MKTINKIFISVVFIFIFTIFSQDVFADMSIKTQVKPNPYNGNPYVHYYITSREDNPITIKGYRINRGNLLTDLQQLNKANNKDINYDYSPKKLKFGQTLDLFNIRPSDEVLEIEVFTDNGTYTFKF